MNRPTFTRSATLIGSDAEPGQVLGNGDSISATDGSECHVADSGGNFMGVAWTRTAEGERVTFVTEGEVEAYITTGETIDTYNQPLTPSATAGELVEATAGTDVVVALARGLTAAGGVKIPVYVTGVQQLGTAYGLA